jgi:hypothetical protein
MQVKPEGKRTLRRHGHEWENNIKMDFKEIVWEGKDWINLAEDWDKWQAAIKMATTEGVQSCSQGTKHILTK